MAALTNGTLLASGGGSGEPRWAVVALPKVTAADTFDAGAEVSPAFTTIFDAVFFSTSNRTATAALATVAGTVITLNGTGVAADSGLLFIVGE